MGTQRYGISIQVFNMISHVAQQMSEISTWTQEEKFQATMYYLVYYINTSLTRRSQLDSSFMLLNTASDVSAADCIIYLKHVKRFSCVGIWLLSLVEIPVKYSSLYYKWFNTGNSCIRTADWNECVCSSQ